MTRIGRIINKDNISGNPTKGRSKKQLEASREAFLRKIEEYSKLSLEELKTLYNGSEDKKPVGGTYKQALIEVTKHKLQEEKEKTLKIAVNDINEERAIEKQEPVLAENLLEIPKNEERQDIDE